MKRRAVLAAIAVTLVPLLAQAQEANRGYDKTDPIVLAVGQEHAGTTDSDQERKYFMAHVEADVEYRLDMTGLSVDLDIYYLGSDDTFLRDSVGRSTNAEDNDERIQFTPKTDAAYFMLHNYDYKESEFSLLLTRSQTYVDEVASLSPVRLDGEVSYEGQVGSRSSLYELGGLTPGSTYRIAIDGLQVNADLLVFSDPLYRDELGRSNKRYTEGDFVTVSTGSDVLYVEVRGQHRSGTPFTLTVEERDRLQDQGSAEEPMQVPVGEEVASEVGEGRSYYFFAATPGRPYTIKLLSPTMDADLYLHGDAGFADVQEMSDNLRGEDEVVSLTAESDAVHFSVDGRHTKGSGANFELHVIEETFDNEGEEQEPMTITGASHAGQMQAEGDSYYRIPVVPGTMYLIKVTQQEIRGTWRFHFYVYDDEIRGRKLASAGYINGNEYKSALIESFTGEWLYLHVLSYDEDFGSNFTVEIQEVHLAEAG